MAKRGPKFKGENKSIKKEIYPHPELAAFLEGVAKQQGKSFSGVVCEICQEWRSKR